MIFDEDDYALLTFKDFTTAYFVQQYFNDYFLASYNATLIVKWVAKAEDSTEKRVEPAKVSSL